MHTLLPSLTGIAGYLVLDGLWLGLLMSGFYRTQLGGLARVAGDRLAPNWYAAAVVYLLLGAGLAALVTSRADSLTSAALTGAAFGLVVYGVYDFTNLSTLRDWPLFLTAVDVAWGTAASALCAMVIWSVNR
jgi:uncharacterized membrane protein